MDGRRHTEELISNIARKIQKELGSGYSERVYHNAFEVSLRKLGIPYESERIVPIVYDNHVIGNLRADLIVDCTIVVELKSVKSLNQPQMHDQVSNYLKLTNLSSGMLINFPAGGGEEAEIKMFRRL